MIEFLSFKFSHFDLLMLASVALMVGMAKAGVHGAGMMVVPILAVVFGAQRSSGLLLPMLSIADIFAVVYYHRHASWKHLRILFPWAVAGVIVGAVVGLNIPDESFRYIMATIIIISVALMLWLERGHKNDIPDYPWFAAVMGIAGGFTSMVGNLAGSVMAVYLLSMHMPKNKYIGTTAWFFLVLNLIKIPFHIFVWHTITLNSFLLDLSALPCIALGAWIGIALVKRIPERIYRIFIIGMTLVAAIYMFFK